jgi:hypothetical protein
MSDRHVSTGAIAAAAAAIVLLIAAARKRGKGRLPDGGKDDDLIGGDWSACMIGCLRNPDTHGLSDANTDHQESFDLQDWWAGRRVCAQVRASPHCGMPR